MARPSFTYILQRGDKTCGVDRLHKKHKQPLPLRLHLSQALKHIAEQFMFIYHFIQGDTTACGDKEAKVGYHNDWSQVTCKKCLATRQKLLQIDPEIANMGVGDVNVTTPPPEPCEKRSPALNDDDPMPFGKHKGEPMRDVPASYLHWLWQQRPISNRKLENYIFNNIEALKREHKDGIWT